MSPLAVRLQGQLYVVGGSVPVEPPPDPDPNPDPGPVPPYDADLGTVGDRPALAVRPGPTNTGPRQSSLQTMTGSQARTAIMNAPVEADGFRYLRRTTITGGLNLNAPEHTNLRFDDCTFTGGAYTVRTYFQAGGARPSAMWPEFRFCRIEGGSSASTIGGYARYLRCDISRGADLAKPFYEGGEYYACYMHDLWHDVGGHCDVFQIVSRAIGLVVHWCNLQAFDDPASPAASSNGYSNGVLQTGTLTNNVGPVYFYDNWMNGGYYTMRFGSNTDRAGYMAEYVLRRNKFGRDNSSGTFYARSQPGVDIDSSNVWEDTGLPV